MPKISIILTSYNHAKYICESIESALNQTYSDFELIIWDDASSDNSWELIQKYSDPRIKSYRNEENLGGVHGVNKAISEIACGEYIAIHHSDDVWELDKLEKQVAILDSNAEIGAVFSRVSITAENGAPFVGESHPYVNVFEQPNRSRHEWLRYFLLSGNGLCHPSVLVRKACYTNCGLYNAAFNQLTDLDLWIRLCQDYEIYILPEKLVNFRVRDGELNSSAGRPDVTVRSAFEYYKVIQRYRKTSSYEELIKILPDTESFCRGHETDLEFSLAMAMINENRNFYHELFILDIVFDIMSDAKRAAHVSKIYGFDFKQYYAVSGQLDPFSRNDLAAGIVQIFERDCQIAQIKNVVSDRENQIARLNNVVSDQEDKIATIRNTLLFKTKAWLRRCISKVAHFVD